MAKDYLRDDIISYFFDEGPYDIEENDHQPEDHEELEDFVDLDDLDDNDFEHIDDDELVTIFDDSDEQNELHPVDMPVPSSPLYPRIYTGDSAKPLMGQYNNSEYIDDNISRTWIGLLSFYG